MQAHDTAAAAAAEPLIELDRATVCRGLEPVLREVSLRIDLGRHTAILGPNGSGKSTFVKLIDRELYALARGASPPVRVLGAERWDVARLRARLGVVSPDLHRDLAALGRLSAEDAVVCGFYATQALPVDRAVGAGERRRARAALADADALHLAARSIASLSTGEARRVLIARALVHGPQALLLDEPTTGLDVAARERFLDALRGLARRGTTLVLVTHHVEEIVPEIGRVVLLREGRVFADGAPDEVLTSERLSALYGARLEIERRHGRYRLSALPDAACEGAVAQARVP
ncbi:MAG TPA: ATP-binding cassette domain-containing protein [Dokdonella sp.]